MSGSAWRLRLRHSAGALLWVLAIGCVALMLGCGGGGTGGGGGGGGVAQECGSASGSTTPVICGLIKDATSGAVVADATVTLRNSSGGIVATATTDATGFYRFNSVSSATTGIGVTSPSGYYSDIARYGSDIWDLALGPITPVAIPVGDKKLGAISIYAKASPPPPPPTKP